jgi:F-type H+/Na+-transporting ATPase subunit alpha
MTTQGLMRPDEISRILREQLESFEGTVDVFDAGTVLSVGDGVARVYGLGGVRASELVEFESGVIGMALNLEEDNVGCVLFGDVVQVHEGDAVRRTGRIIEVPVGEQLLGRVVDPLGKPLDGKGELNAGQTLPVERQAPGVVDRQAVRQSLATGIMAVDATVPIGRGQRELIIGDRSTGKTAIAIDAIINQRSSGVKCVYVAIGQRAAAVAKVVAQLEAHGAMAYTTVVSATAADPAPLQYLAPYAGCSMGEYFRDRGGDALVVYDDLSKQAWAYREMSLVLRRPPGREAYPGDVFYLHSRLLERASKLNDQLGAGSLTALPIIETLEGDVSTYIPTNVISITDGQILLRPELFHAGIRPAIDIGASVSRVSSAKTAALRAVSSRLKGDISRYAEVQAFAQLGAAEMDPVTRALLEQGEKLHELLKQGQFCPMSLGEQVAVLYSARGLERIPAAQVRRFEREFLEHLHAEHAALLDTVTSSQELTEASQQELDQALSRFTEHFRASA